MLKKPGSKSPLMASSSSSATSSSRHVRFGTDGSFELERTPSRPRLTLEEQARAADHLSMRLLEIDSDDEDAEEEILRETLGVGGGGKAALLSDEERMSIRESSQVKAMNRVCLMVSLALLALVVLGSFAFLGFHYVGPPNQPIGPYQLLERQEGMEFFSYYNFYEGRDSVGSNGFNMYVSEETALLLGIANVTFEEDAMNVYRRRNLEQSEEGTQSSTDNVSAKNRKNTTEPFVYMMSSPTPEGPRNSIRLEGKRRFHRGLFVIDLRHMPAGCGVWPAFWLTDEANWPVNGEIDIVEGVNFQSVAKTALHSTRGCSMDDIPVGVKSGTWDTAVGIPDKKTGIPDMTMRYATNCFVYDPHQWLNQGCVAVDEEGASLGGPVNDNGGGVYVLEWDPVNRHIRTWVFTPHTSVPENLRDSIETASEPDESRVVPNPEEWPLPYGYFAIGEGTDCPTNHFKNMRLVFNLAFCGSVAGNRYNLDCPKQAKKFKTCNDWIKSEPEEINEAYWKVRGVYVYEREWQKAWDH